MILNIFSAEKIQLSSRLSRSDWAHLPSILKKAGTTELVIKTEVDWKELETALNKLPEITVLSISDIQWNEENDFLANIDNKQLVLRLETKL